MRFFHRRLALLVLLFGFALPVHAQTTYYVDDTAGGADDGTAHYSETVEVALGLDRPYVVTKPSPNPTAREATLEVTVGETQHVEVAVYDALGRRVSTLYDGELAADRPETVRLEGSRLQSGPYFLWATGETFTATRRVTVVQ